MTKNNIKNILSAVALVLVVGGLFAYPILTDPNRPLVKSWNSAGIGCLSSHSAVAGAGQHIHQQLIIMVDGVEEVVPGNTGIVTGCMAEMHVHEGELRKIHLESIIAGKEFKLSDFFIVYGKPFMRDGYKLEIVVNGEIVNDPANFILEDKQAISIAYTSEVK